ncbi:MAG: hypothetical protein AMXMBFR64_10750 [Myxococcales bacterium]
MIKILTTTMAVLLLGAWSSDATAQAVYWDRASLLKDFFSTSQRVTFKKLALDATQRAAVENRLGKRPPAEVTVYYGMTGTTVDGFAIIDNELGQHEPITFGVLIGTDGAMKRLEIMVYRESHGDEVREGRFRRQFVGRKASDPVRHGADIVAVTGATISSKSMANGARRALVLVDELLIKPGLKTLASTSAP